MISSIEQKGEQEKLPLIREYKAKIEDELLEICNDILSIIETELIPNSTSEEGKVFYYKMKGDYHRYLAEFQVRLLVCAISFYTSQNDIHLFSSVSIDLPSPRCANLPPNNLFYLFYWDEAGLREEEGVVGRCFGVLQVCNRHCRA